MSEKDILVVGYPKSGNTWTSRLLGDILNSPVTGLGSAHPIAEEGLDRKGDYIVRQLHMLPCFDPDTCQYSIESAWKYCVARYDGEKVIHVIRDPRDIAVSVMYYWEIPDGIYGATETLNGKGVLQGNIKGWNEYIDQWYSLASVPFYTVVRYEELKADTRISIIKAMKSVGIKYDYKRVYLSIKRQSFSERKTELEKSGSKYNYGATIQAKNLRKGEVGDWRNHFTKEDGAYFELVFGDYLRLLKYEDDKKWYEKLPERK